MLAICSRSVSRSKSALKILSSKFKEIKLNKSNKNLGDNNLINFVKDSEVIIVGIDKIDKKLLDHCPKLKLIGKYGVGTNNIDFNELKKRKIRILLQPGINKRAVSELTLAFMIMGLRDICKTTNEVKKSNWPFFAGEQLTNKKIGIIGCGNIGKDLIKLLKPFDCKINTHDIKPNYSYLKRNKLTNSSINFVLKNSDIISIHIPYNIQNHNIISNKKISLLKKDSLLINTSRGDIVDENFLYKFLKKNNRAMGIFDVMKVEPPNNKKLISLDNFILTSHIAGTTKSSLESASIDCAKKIINVINEERK
tara:strand:+ start:3794 stop:4720 length:927 start_codon:yes stop_codon:yes gene_type:complete